MSLSSDKGSEREQLDISLAEVSLLIATGNDASTAVGQSKAQSRRRSSIVAATSPYHTLSEQHSLLECPLHACPFIIARETTSDEHSIVHSSSSRVDKWLIRKLCTLPLTPSHDVNLESMDTSDLTYCCHSLPHISASVIFYASLPRAKNTRPEHTIDMSKLPFIVVVSAYGIIKALYSVPLMVSKDHAKVDSRQMAVWEQPVMRYVHSADLGPFLKALSRWFRQLEKPWSAEEECEVRFRWNDKTPYRWYRVVRTREQDNQEHEAIVLMLIARHQEDSLFTGFVQRAWDVITLTLDLVECVLPRFLARYIDQIRGLVDMIARLPGQTILSKI